jgi:hypothetical protein
MIRERRKEHKRKKLRPASLQAMARKVSRMEPLFSCKNLKEEAVSLGAIGLLIPE